MSVALEIGSPPAEKVKATASSESFDFASLRLIVAGLSKLHDRFLEVENSVERMAGRRGPNYSIDVKVRVPSRVRRQAKGIHVAAIAGVKIETLVTHGCRKPGRATSPMTENLHIRPERLCD